MLHKPCIFKEIHQHTGPTRQDGRAHYFGRRPCRLVQKLARQRRRPIELTRQSGKQEPNDGRLLDWFGVPRVCRLPCHFRLLYSLFSWLYLDVETGATKSTGCPCQLSVCPCQGVTIAEGRNFLPSQPVIKSPRLPIVFGRRLYLP